MDKIWAIIATAFAVIFGLFRHEKHRADKLDEKSRTNSAGGLNRHEAAKLMKCYSDLGRGVEDVYRDAK